MKRARFGLAALAVLMAGPFTEAAAAPPPPPPEYVDKVAGLLAGDAGTNTVGALAPFIAEDVREYVDGTLVADGKAAWLRYWTKAHVARGRFIGLGEGWEEKGASLIVVDEYDTVDRSNLPKHFLVDPRIATRATHYQFAEDAKIHVIQTVQGAGFWMTAPLMPPAKH